MKALPDSYHEKKCSCVKALPVLTLTEVSPRRKPCLLLTMREVATHVCSDSARDGPYSMKVLSGSDPERGGPYNMKALPGSDPDRWSS